MERPPGDSGQSVAAAYLQANLKFRASWQVYAKGSQESEKAMAEPGKSLRVSHGRFSCTLDGFADPVAAMIALTGHVRGMAARDPRFAASDGTPRAADLDAAGGGPAG